MYYENQMMYYIRSNNSEDVNELIETISNLEYIMNDKTFDVISGRRICDAINRPRFELRIKLEKKILDMLMEEYYQPMYSSNIGDFNE